MSQMQTAGGIDGKGIAGTKLADSAVTAEKLAANAVTSAKIAGGAVTAAKMAGGVLPGKTKHVLADSASASHKLTGVSVTQYGSVATVSGYLQCVYAKGGTDTVTIISDARIPDPAAGGYVYVSTPSGELAIDGGKIDQWGASSVHGRVPFFATYVCS